MPVSPRIGWAGTSLKEDVNSPKIKKTAGGPEVTETFNCNQASAEAAITARGETFGDPCPIAGGIYAAAVLQDISINKSDVRNVKVIYVWRVPTGADQPNPPVGTLTLEADSNAIDIPIGKNPNASGTNYDFDKKIGKDDWEGIESYLSPQPTFSRTEILNAFTFSEANIVENVGKRFTGVQMNSEGMSAATDNKWLKMGLTVSSSGANFRKVERWQYAGEGWNTDIYAAWS